MLLINQNQHKVKYSNIFLKQIFQERISLDGEITLSSEYLELYISTRLNVFLENKNTDSLLTPTLAPLKSVTQHELKEIAKLLEISGEIAEISQEIIDSLAKKYIQTKPSFVKSFSHIEQLQQ